MKTFANCIRVATLFFFHLVIGTTKKAFFLYIDNGGGKEGGLNQYVAQKHEENVVIPEFELISANPWG